MPVRRFLATLTRTVSSSSSASTRRRSAVALRFPATSHRTAWVSIAGQERKDPVWDCFVMGDPAPHLGMRVDDVQPDLFSGHVVACACLVCRVVAGAELDKLCCCLDQWRSFQGMKVPMSLLCLPTMKSPYWLTSARQINPRDFSTLTSAVAADYFLPRRLMMSSAIAGMKCPGRLFTHRFATALAG